jgi:hypothetical protein
MKNCEARDARCFVLAKYALQVYFFGDCGWFINVGDQQVVCDKFFEVIFLVVRYWLFFDFSPLK